MGQSLRAGMRQHARRSANDRPARVVDVLAVVGMGRHHDAPRTQPGIDAWDAGARARIGKIYQCKTEKREETESQLFVAKKVIDNGSQ